MAWDKMAELRAELVSVSSRYGGVNVPDKYYRHWVMAAVVTMALEATGGLFFI